MARINLQHQLMVAKCYITGTTRKSNYTCNHFEFSDPKDESWPNVRTRAMVAHWAKFATKYLGVSGVLEPYHFEDTPHHRNIEKRVAVMTEYVGYLGKLIQAAEVRKLKRNKE